MGAALHRDTKKGILSGAFGAMASEIAAEMMFDMEDIAGQILARSEDDFLTQEEFLLAYRDEVTQRANLAQLRVLGPPAQRYRIRHRNFVKHLLTAALFDER